jgi:hypothetical protein
MQARRSSASGVLNLGTFSIHRRIHAGACAALLAVSGPVAVPLRAQEPGEAPQERPAVADARAISGVFPRLHFQALVTPGSRLDVRLRTLQLLGEADAAGSLLRSTSSLTPALPTEAGRLRWALVAPELLTIWNSELPFSPNEGAMWAGRGWTTQLTAGMRAEYGPVTLVLAPHIVRAQNRDFRIFHSQLPDRGSLIPPWYTGRHSIDLPARHGDLPFTRFDPGQSTLSLRSGALALGASTEDQWWGPGIRNAIVLGNNAAGIPHLFFRTGEPGFARLGSFEGRWIAGVLSESLYFDAEAENDLRSLNAVVGTFRPALDPDLTVGMARSVYGPMSGAALLPGRFLDVLRYWDAPGDPADWDGETTTDGVQREQILSLFARWLFPEQGFEAYAEWARLALPRSLTDFLTTPNHSQGYTLGLQWAHPMRGDGAVRLQAETTYLEQSPSYRLRPTPYFYVSPVVPQGYTHRGQVIGAAIGPGASSQWLAADWLAPRWQAGAFAGRIRWDNDAYYSWPTGQTPVAHDVSLLAGLRGGVQLGGLFLSAELTRAKRYNYLYHNYLQGTTGEGALDPVNTTLRLGLSPWTDGRRSSAP